MKGVKRLCGLLLAFVTIFGLSFGVFSNDTSALSANWLSAQTTYRWSTSGSWTSVVKSITTGPAQVSIWNSIPQTGINYLQFRQVNVSGSVSPAQTGDYYSGEFTMQLHFSGDNPNFNFTGGFNCDWIADVRIQPEVGTVVQHTDSIKTCRVSQTNLDADIYMTVSSSGKLSQSSAVSSYLIILRGLDPSGPFFSAEVSPGIHYYLTLMPGDINFTVSTDASTSGLGEINQSINNVNNQLEEMNDRDAQDREDLQNASDSASDSADSMGEDVSDAGEQLFYVLTTIFGILTNPPETDCKISGNTGFMNLGDIDLCALSPPPAINIIGTLLLIGLCVPFAVSAISMLIKVVEGVFTT